MKLRLLCERLTEESLAVTNDDRLPPRVTFDWIFSSAHLRVEDRRR